MKDEPFYKDWICKRMEDKTTNAEIQKALDLMHDDLEKTNNMVASRVNSTPKPPPPVAEEKPPVEESKNIPLIYFSYSQENPWSNSLWSILVHAGYLVFDPWKKTPDQIGQRDVPLLDRQPLRVVKALCPTLQLPEEVLLPFENVWNIFQRGDTGDNFSGVFRCLWFLARSSLIICDLSFADPSSSQTALIAKQLGIPVIGIMPTSGQLNPWMHRASTALFSSTDLVTLLPMIQGYAPL